MKILKVIIVCILAMGLLASVSFAEEKTYTLRYNTVAGPTMPQTLAIKKFAEVVKEISGGKIEVKVFHSGQLGDQKTSILNVKRGILEMYDGGSPSWFSDLLNYPEVGVLETPYVYRDLVCVQGFGSYVQSSHRAYRSKVLGLHCQKAWDSGSGLVVFGYPSIKSEEEGWCRPTTGGLKGS